MLTYTAPHTSLHKPARLDLYLEFVSVGVRVVPSADEADVCFFVYEDDVCVSISLDDFTAVSLLARQLSGFRKKREGTRLDVRRDSLDSFPDARVEEEPHGTAIFDEDVVAVVLVFAGHFQEIDQADSLYQ